MSKLFMELKNVSKKFGNVSALENIDLKIGNNEIIGILGDNGAGKSTLIKVVSGLHNIDEGEIYLKDELMKDWNYRIARTAGIETVYQDKALAEQQSIYRNIFMGREICNSMGYINIREEKKKTEKLLKEMGFTSKLLDPNSIIMNCSGGEREGVAISRAMYFNAKLVILDEPATALSITETQKVLNFVAKVKERGSSALFIAHNVYHTYKVSDRFIILDRGMVKDEIKKEDISDEELIKHMISIAGKDKIEV